MDKNKIITFHLIPVQGHGGWNLSEHLRAQGGTHPGPDALPSQEDSHSPTLTQPGAM